VENQQYKRQKLYYRWSLILCILALVGYSAYFLFERYLNNIPLFIENRSLYLRFSLIIYFAILLIILNKLPNKLFKLLGFFIAVPLGWMISFISYLTIGYEGITVTGYIFLIMASAIVFDFSVLAFSVALVLILIFHFTLLSYYFDSQPEGLLNHIFLLGLSSILGLTTNYLVNIIKKNEFKALHEREMLLREIHHRVKNNLQVISSLLNLQIGSISDTSTKSVVLESQSRVKSMALIHQLLYESQTFSNIDFSKYLNQLVASAHSSFCDTGKNIQYIVKAENILLDIDTAVPLGLITNELVTNAYKYAFTNKTNGEIIVELKKNESSGFTLKISDNGNGLPENFDLEKTETLGLKLVKLLTEQIDGKIDFFNQNGAVFIIQFRVTSKN
jgi:two-component sensor histidine kinase